MNLQEEMKKAVKDVSIKDMKRYKIHLRID